MDKDRVEGSWEQAKGKVKEVAGRAVGNDRLRAEGEIDQVAGKTEKTYGDTKERVKDALDDARPVDRPIDRP